MRYILCLLANQITDILYIDDNFALKQLSIYLWIFAPVKLNLFQYLTIWAHCTASEYHIPFPIKSSFFCSEGDYFYLTINKEILLRQWFMAMIFTSTIF